MRPSFSSTCLTVRNNAVIVSIEVVKEIANNDQTTARGLIDGSEMMRQLARATLLHVSHSRETDQLQQTPNLTSKASDLS